MGQGSESQFCGGTNPACMGLLFKIQEHIKSMDEKQEALLYSHTEINKKLFVGNGVPPFSTRLDRLEQDKTRLNRHFVVIYTAVVGALAVIVFNALSGRVHIGGENSSSSYSTETRTNTRP